MANEEKKPKVKNAKDEEKRAKEFAEKKEKERLDEENKKISEEEERKKKEERKAKEEQAKAEKENPENQQNSEEKKDEPDKAEQFLKDVVEVKVERVELIEDKVEKRDFTKAPEFEKFEYSLGELDKFLHHEYRDINQIVRYTIEMLIVSFLFLIVPVIVVLLTEKPTFKTLFKVFTKIKNKNVKKFFNVSLFITLTYDIFILSKLLMDNLLYMIVWFLTLLEIGIEGTLATIIQIVCSSTDNLKNTIATFFVFLLASKFLGGYTLFKTTIDINHLALTILIWYVCFSFMLFIENLLMNVIFGEIGRSSFSGRIYDANCKGYIFEKLQAISLKKIEGKQAMQSVIDNMTQEYESSIFLKHSSLNLTSKESAIDLAESIFGYLGIKQLEYKKIKMYFPNNYDDVYKYLSQGKGNERKEPIPYDIFKEQAIALYKQRVDIALSLSDRDKILQRLNIVLIIGVCFLGGILFLFLLNVDYKIYLASVGPFLFAFGWIFQDSIKELYKCFVFLLISHPFDNGDRITVFGEELVVIDIDLFYTTFYNSLGRVVYIPNLVLLHQKIGNIRRSIQESEELEILIDGTSNFSKIVKLREKISENLKKINSDFTGETLIKSFELAGDNIKLVLNIQYNTNLQEFLPRFARHELLIKNVKDTLSSLGIGHKESFVFKS